MGDKRCAKNESVNAIMPQFAWKKVEMERKKETHHVGKWAGAVTRLDWRSTINPPMNSWVCVKEVLGQRGGGKAGLCKNTERKEDFGRSSITQKSLD